MTFYYFNVRFSVFGFDENVKNKINEKQQIQ